MRRAQHDLMHLLVDLVLQRRTVILDLSHESLDIRSQHLGRESQLPDCQPHHTILLTVGLGEGVGGALVADHSREVHGSLADDLEQRLLTRGHGAGAARLDGQGGALAADDTDAAVALDGVRETDAAFDDGAGFEGFQFDGEVVFDRERVLPYFESAGVSVMGRRGRPEAFRVCCATIDGARNLGIVFCIVGLEAVARLSLAIEARHWLMEAMVGGIGQG
ncbi:hypothetical protein VP1G_10506 [Cytospora mali]|uniref:Uncharacterized protein n=1 Tax=Cytospora mali TaxID=578113 RepID=A0A194ULT5_CYTMA|nr:hypothetical protein VP1G_10506 [Valsa mali var. pyri (nom. inval.)]